MSKNKKGLIDWLRCGNDCESCPAFWCSKTSYEYDEWDCGCMAGKDYDEGVCRLPYIVRWYKARRSGYFDAHQYDDFGDWCAMNEAKDEVAIAALKKKLGDNRVIAWRSINDGSLHEMHQEMVLEDMSFAVRTAIDDYDREHRPKTIRGEWAALILKTWKRFAFWAKSWVCAG